MRRRSSWLGHHRTVDGHDFECVAAEPVRYGSGKVRLRLTWATRCSTCGVDFRFHTHRRPADVTLQRLCPEHRPTHRRTRRLRHLGLGGPTPGLLDLVLYQDREGRVFTHAGVMLRTTPMLL